jgi:hypothetical protein
MLDYSDPFFYIPSLKPNHTNPPLDSWYAILGSKLLYSLDVDIEYSDEQDLSSIALVFDILSACKEMNELKLRIHSEGDNFAGKTPTALISCHGLR